MKKLITSLGLLTLMLITMLSCTNTLTEISLPTTISMDFIAPTNGTNLVLNPNRYNLPATTLKWSSANFGYVNEVVYTLQIIKANESFSGTGIKPSEISIGNYFESAPTTHEFDIKNTVLNSNLNSYEPIENSNIFNTSINYKMRIVAKPAAQVASSTSITSAFSQEVTFSATTYEPIEETPKIYVTGNFGSASTFADWNINSNGTSNSPLLYSPTKDGIYNGFVYMNVASPQFKFASPDDTSLNIKGVGTPYASDKIDLDTNIAPGTLVSSTDISTGNVITPSITTTAGTYYVYADWTNNKYKIAKRLISLKGATTQNIVKYLSFVSDNTSPYYRMYVATNVTLSAGSGYIQVKDNSSGSADKLERFGIDNSNANLLVSPDAASSIKNKLKLGGQTQFNVNTPGTYTIVLDLRNSAIYNLRIIPN
jgi:hypothetical protein